MSFAEPILLAGFILVPLAMLAYGSLQRRRRRESAAWANPALVPEPDDRAARLAAPSPAAPAAARAVRAGRRARPPAAHGRRAAARGEHRDGHGHQRLDERHGRAPGPARPPPCRRGQDADAARCRRRSGSG